MTIYTSTLFFPNILSYCWNHSVQNKTNTQKILFVQHLIRNFKFCEFSYRVPLLCCLSLSKGEASCDTGARAAAAGHWDLPAVGAALLGTFRAGPGEVTACLDTQCCPRQGCAAKAPSEPRAEPAATHVCCHSRDPLPELGAATQITSSGRRAVETHLHTSATCTGSLILCLQKERCCLPELPLQVQSQLFPTPAPGRGRDESNKTLPFGCC